MLDGALQPCGWWCQLCLVSANQPVPMLTSCSMQLADGTTFTTVHVEARMQLPAPGQGLWVSGAGGVPSPIPAPAWHVAFMCMRGCLCAPGQKESRFSCGAAQIQPLFDCPPLVQPAFWMFPTELKYGVWAASGEVRYLGSGPPGLPASHNGLPQRLRLKLQ